MLMPRIGTVEPRNRCAASSSVPSPPTAMTRSALRSRRSASPRRGRPRGGRVVIHSCRTFSRSRNALSASAVCGACGFVRLMTTMTLLIFMATVSDDPGPTVANGAEGFTFLFAGDFSGFPGRGRFERFQKRANEKAALKRTQSKRCRVRQMPGSREASGLRALQRRCSACEGSVDMNFDKSNPMKTILCAGKFLSLVKEGHWEYAERAHEGGAAVIVAVTHERKLLLVEQYRIPVHARTIELPAGIVGDEPGSSSESCLEAARRELLEETGYAAGRMELLHTGAVSAGLTSERVTLVLASDLQRRHAGGGVAHEEVTVHV